MPGVRVPVGVCRGNERCTGVCFHKGGLSLPDDCAKFPDFPVGDAPDHHGDFRFGFAQILADEVHEFREVGLVAPGNFLIVRIALALHPENTGGNQRVGLPVIIKILVGKGMLQGGLEVIILVDALTFPFAAIPFRIPSSKALLSCCFRVNSGSPTGVFDEGDVGTGILLLQCTGESELQSEAIRVAML